MERVKGIEPSYEAWEAAVLPLNYTRDANQFTRSDSMIVEAEGLLRGAIPRRTLGATHLKGIVNPQPEPAYLSRWA